MKFRMFTSSLAGMIALIALPAAHATVIIDFDSSAVVASTSLGQRRTEDGFNIDYFWYQNVGSTPWSSSFGHDHNSSTSNSTFGENQHFNGSDELQGFRLSRIDGAGFSLISLDIDGGSGSVIAGVSGMLGVLLADESFMATGAVTSQFTLFEEGITGGFTTITPAGFSNVMELWISSTDSYDFDNIHLALAVPEPMTLLLVGFGLAGLGVAGRRRLWGRTSPSV